MLNKIRLLSLAYGIVSVRKFVNYVTNKVLTSRHDCVLERYTCDLDMPKRLANCKLYTKYRSAHPCLKFPFNILYVTKKSHRIFWEPRCHCKLCVKNRPASLKSQCVNKLVYLLDTKPKSSNV